MFVCCNGKIILFTEINNSKKGLSHFLDSPQLRASVKDFAEKHELGKFFLYGFGSHHFYLHQRYTSNPEMVMQHRVLSVHF